MPALFTKVIYKFQNLIEVQQEQDFHTAHLSDVPKENKMRKKHPAGT